ncbi:MAG: DUF58 domain-containing protein [Candidatus Delongbacteria bacterium]|nr:DUF58 domain-containing protein [Candidatus Delongbacteria bacterium]MBN2834899.1 DUF58 domain-containing protein [Candidatus Delongbacteria bacterium]
MIEDFTKLLEPSFLASTSNIEIGSKLILEGFMLGKHKSRFHGFSAEFNDRREYIPGDNIRDLDWKAYGKTGKYFTKLYEDETNIHSYLFMDISKSMNYKARSNITKLIYSQYLCAALARILIFQNDSVALGLYGHDIVDYLPPKAGRQNLNNILKMISSLKLSESRVTTESYDKISGLLKKNGIVYFVTDFLENPDEIIEKILLVKRSGNDVIIFLIHDEEEKEFDFKRGSRIVDSETGNEIDLNSDKLSSLYREEYRKHYHEIIAKLTEYEILSIMVSTDTAFHIPLTEMSLKNGNIR